LIFFSFFISQIIGYHKKVLVVYTSPFFQTVRLLKGKVDFYDLSRHNKIEPNLHYIIKSARNSQLLYLLELKDICDEAIQDILATSFKMDVRLLQCVSDFDIVIEL